MAREIFLLDYLRESSVAEHAALLQDHVNMLGRLGVGGIDHRDANGDSYRTGIQPLVFHDGTQAAKLDAAFMAWALGAGGVHKADISPDSLPLPFVNDMQCNAHIVGALTLSLSRAGEQLEPGSTEHMVVVAQPELNAEFLRVNPNGVARERFNVAPKSSVMNRYYIERIALGERLSTAFPPPPVHGA